MDKATILAIVERRASRLFTLLAASATKLTVAAAHYALDYAENALARAEQAFNSAFLRVKLRMPTIAEV